MALKGLLRELQTVRSNTEGRVKASTSLLRQLATLAETMLRLERTRGKGFVYESAALHDRYTPVLQRLLTDVQLESGLQQRFEREQLECASLHESMSQVSGIKVA